MEPKTLEDSKDIEIQNSHIPTCCGVRILLPVKSEFFLSSMNINPNRDSSFSDRVPGKDTFEQTVQ